MHASYLNVPFLRYPLHSVEDRVSRRNATCDARYETYEYQDCGSGTTPRWLGYSWVYVKRSDLVFRRQWANYIAVMKWMANAKKILGPTVSGISRTASSVGGLTGPGIAGG